MAPNNPQRPRIALPHRSVRTSIAAGFVSAAEPPAGRG